MVSVNKFFLIISSLVFPLCMYAFSPGSDARRNIDLDVRFMPLELDEEVYEGIIYDEKNKFKSTKISFGGITKIMGVKNDSDDSSSILRISNIKKLKVEDANYRSPRHTTNDNMLFFVKVKIVHNTPNEVSGTMLIPHKVVLCAEDVETGTEKAWRLRDITSLEINHLPSGPDINRSMDRSVHSRSIPRGVVGKEQSFLGSLWAGFIGGVHNNVKALRNWLSKTS
ncbi:hypothetical protein COB28_00385 [Candidatus Dependentiae bacterium]|nr:MAG: hypothetical protein COB28_00385 [Candidatus Dependentiae bacterium]